MGVWPFLAPIWWVGRGVFSLKEGSRGYKINWGTFGGYLKGGFLVLISLWRGFTGDKNTGVLYKVGARN